MQSRKLPSSARIIEGKTVRVFLFARKSSLDGAAVIYQVEGFTKDDALTRLCRAEHWVARSEWNFIEELDPEHDVGALGRKLYIAPDGVTLTAIAGIVRGLFRPH